MHKIYVFNTTVDIVYEHRKSDFITLALNLMRTNEIIFTLHNNNAVFLYVYALAQLLDGTRSQHSYIRVMYAFFDFHVAPIHPTISNKGKLVIKSFAIVMLALCIKALIIRFFFIIPIVNPLNIDAMCVIFPSSCLSCE